jgi:hypothetical protein
MSKKTIIAIATLAIVTIALVLIINPFSSENADPQVDFANGNIYMSTELCEADELDVSEELQKKIEDWYADVLSGENPDGKVVCTDD